jgi:hypothetical protein
MFGGRVFSFVVFFATLDPLASSLQAPRSSSFQAFKFSSLQAFKPSSLFQALKHSSLRGAKHSSLRFNWAYRFCKHENLLEGRGEVQPNCIHTFYNHKHTKDQSPAKVIAESLVQTAYLLPLKGHPNHSTSACCHYTKHPSKRRGNRILPHNHNASSNKMYTIARI